MGPSAPRAAPTAAWRLARKSWQLLYSDSQRCVVVADEALRRAARRADFRAQGWARLTRGFHLIWYATPQEAMAELQQAQDCFTRAQDAAGELLAQVGLARCAWRDGAFRASLERVLPLRDEGLRRLQHAERGMLLSTIAGCYSELGQSQQAFAYMYQALRESGAKAQGFDVVLYCNLAHELIQLGDYHQALSYLQEGLARCAQLNNPRLFSVLSINRIICLTSLDRPVEALPDVREMLALPADSGGRGPMNAHFESMALAALRAGDAALGEQLLGRAREALARGEVPDELGTLRVAEAELLMARGQWDAAARRLSASGDAPAQAESLRVRCMHYHALAAVHEQLGEPVLALRALRAWQALHTERALQASGARYQAAALQTELLRMQHELHSIDERRRRTERARAELELANQQLKAKIAEVESLQRALRQQATRDFLTGLFNRRHLENVLPGMLAMAQREGQPLSVAIIDLDHFKSVNDEFGHATGDRLLAAFGALLEVQGRKSDVLCRYGGEEFCLLMPRTPAASARRKIASLLKLWTQQRAADRASPPGARSFSAGVVDSLGVPGDASALLGAADALLLQAKRQGRNRVLVRDGGDRVAA